MEIFLKNFHDLRLFTAGFFSYIDQSHCKIQYYCRQRTGANASLPYGEITLIITSRGMSRAVKQMNRIKTVRFSYFTLKIKTRMPLFSTFSYIFEVHLTDEFNDYPLRLNAQSTAITGYTGITIFSREG